MCGCVRRLCVLSLCMSPCAYRTGATCVFALRPVEWSNQCQPPPLALLTLLCHGMGAFCACALPNQVCDKHRSRLHGGTHQRHPLRTTVRRARQRAAAAADDRREPGPQPDGVHRNVRRCGRDHNGRTFLPRSAVEHSVAVWQ